MLATVVNGLGVGNKLLIWPDGRIQGSLGAGELDEQVQRHGAELFSEQQSDRASFTVSGEAIDVFFDLHLPRSKLIIIGAVHIAIPLTTFANALEFHTIVIDPRQMFATRERFPHTDELLVEWPDDALAEIPLNETTYIVALTHDDKLDNPALKLAIESKARYIGALGARSTHAKRLTALKAMGATEEQLARIQAPIGLNIGAVGPTEIAVAIIAEIVAARRGYL